MAQCMEIEWRGNGIFCHKTGIKDWRSIVENHRLRSVSRIQDIHFGPWTAIYEVENVAEGSVWHGTERIEKAQYLVAECVADAPAAAR